MSNTVAIHFGWELVEVGKFKTGTFKPDAVVQIQVPVEYLVDVTGYIEQGKIPVLTPEGVHYCYLQLHDAMTLDPADLSKMYNDTPSQETTDDVGWGSNDDTKWDE